MNPASRIGQPARLAVKGAAVDLFVGALALALIAAALSIALSAGGRAYSAMSPRMQGDLTLAVRSRNLESADAAAALAAEALARLPMVAAAIPLEPDPADDPAGGAILGSRPPPGEVRLLSVTLKAGAPEDTDAIARALRDQGLAFGIDDHRGFAGSVERTLALSAAMAVTGLVLAALLMAVFAWLSGRRQAAKSGERFDLMRRLGAAPSFMGRIVSAVSWRSTLVGAVIGAAASVVVVSLFGLGRLAVVLPLLGASLKAAPIDMVGAAVCPVVLAFLAGLFAGAGARSALARAERR